MKLFDWLHSTFSSIKNGFENSAHSLNDDHQNRINPASSLPMSGSVDIHGNSFGAGSSISHDVFADNNRHHDYSNQHTNSFNDYHNHHHHDAFHHSTPHHDYHDPFRNY